MKGRFMIENPDKIEATLKLKMSVKDWTDLRDQLKNEWPSSNLCHLINGLIIQARHVFYHDSGGDK